MIKRFVKKDEKLWEDNSLAKILIYTPAVIITQLLVLPFIILAVPFMLFGKSFQNSIIKFLLTIQNTIGLSFWYFISDYFFPDLIPLPFYFEIPLCLLVVYFNFKVTISTLTNKTLNKYYFKP